MRLGLDGARWGLPLPCSRGRPPARARRRVAEVIELVGAGDYAERPMGELSGGEQQRLLIAQALVRRPRMLMLDEPLDSLDLANQGAIAALVQAHLRDEGVTVLLVAHDVNPILGYLDRVVYSPAARASRGAAEVITARNPERLYGAPIEVLRASDGRLVVVGQPEAPAPPRPPPRPDRQRPVSLEPVADVPALRTTTSWSTRCWPGRSWRSWRRSSAGSWSCAARPSPGTRSTVIAFPGAAGAVLAGLPAGSGLLLACVAAALASARRAPAGAAAARRVGEDRRGPGPRAGLGFFFCPLRAACSAGPVAAVRHIPGHHAAVRCSGTPAVAAAPLCSRRSGARCCSLGGPGRVARGRGVPSRRSRAGFLLVLGLAVAATSQITGALLVFALLVAPAATAQRITAGRASASCYRACSPCVVWRGLGVAYYSPYPVGFWVTTFAFGVYCSSAPRAGAPAAAASAAPGPGNDNRRAAA